MTTEDIIAAAFAGDVSAEDALDKVTLLTAVQRHMFCKSTGQCLDVSRALLVERYTDGTLTEMSGPFDVPAMARKRGVEPADFMSQLEASIALMTERRPELTARIIVGDALKGATDVG